jgi:hypothetical protein
MGGAGATGDRRQGAASQGGLMMLAPSFRGGSQPNPE